MSETTMNQNVFDMVNNGNLVPNNQNNSGMFSMPQEIRNPHHDKPTNPSGLYEDYVIYFKLS